MSDHLEQRLRRLQLRCKHPVSHLLAGEYRSIFKGNGIEFDDVREYVCGDDVRTIDWKVTARTGKPHIKRYIEEREQALILMLDISASTAFGHGDHSKVDTARELCALIAWSASHSKNRVGLILFSDHVEHYVPPARGRNHVMRIVSDLLEIQPTAKGTDLRAALEFAGEVVRKRSVVFLVSDFLGEGYEQSLQILARRHDLTAVCIQHQLEQALPILGMVHCQDMETGRSQWVDLSNQTARNRHQSTARSRMLALADLCSEANIGHIPLTSDSDCVAALVSYFQKRHRRVADETGG